MLDQADIGMGCALGTGGGMVQSLVAAFAPADVPAGWQVLGSCAAGEPAVLVDGTAPEVIGWDHFRG